MVTLPCDCVVSLVSHLACSHSSNVQTLKPNVADALETVPLLHPEGEVTMRSWERETRGLNRQELSSDIKTRSEWVGR